MYSPNTQNRYRIGSAFLVLVRRCWDVIHSMNTYSLSHRSLFPFSSLLFCSLALAACRAVSVCIITFYVVQLNLENLAPDVDVNTHSIDLTVTHSSNSCMYHRQNRAQQRQQKNNMEENLNYCYLCNEIVEMMFAIGFMQCAEDEFVLFQSEFELSRSRWSKHTILRPLPLEFHFNSTHLSRSFSLFVSVSA